MGEQGLQAVRHKLAGEHEAIMPRLAVVSAVQTTSNALVKLLGVILAVLARMGAPFGPVHNSHTPPGHFLSELDEQHGGDVMLVHVTDRLAEISELGVILHIRDNVHCQLSVHVKPLRSFSPLVDADLWEHSLVVPTPAHRPRIIEHSHEALVRVHHVFVSEGEIPEEHSSRKEARSARSLGPGARSPATVSPHRTLRCPPTS